MNIYDTKWSLRSNSVQWEERDDEEEGKWLSKEVGGRQQTLKSLVDLHCLFGNEEIFENAKELFSWNKFCLVNNSSKQRIFP